MSNTTAFLGKLIGIYLIVFGLAMLLRKVAMLDAVMGIMHSPPLTLMLAMIILAAGIAIVLTHNVWSGGVFPVVVTVIGWLTVLKGAALMFLSSDQMAGVMTAVHYEKCFYAYAIAPIVLGGYLTWMGCRGCCPKKK